MILKYSHPYARIFNWLTSTLCFQMPNGPDRSHVTLGLLHHIMLKIKHACSHSQAHKHHNSFACRCAHKRYRKESMTTTTP